MTGKAQARRKAAVDGVKRDLIKAAAKSTFAKTGLERASVREIARLAGYTTGAIYFHYANKEELYADILSDSLDALLARVSDAASNDDGPVAALDMAFRAMVGFYDENRSDLDLSLYLFGGSKPGGLTPALNRELNKKLLAVMAVFRQHLARSGVKETELTREVAGLFNEMIGLLIAAQTGRLKILKTDLATMLDHHTANLARRLAPDR